MDTFLCKGPVIFKSGYPVGVLFKGSEKFPRKFKGYEIFPENIKGYEISKAFFNVDYSVKKRKLRGMKILVAFFEFPSNKRIKGCEI